VPPRLNLQLDPSLQPVQLLIQHLPRLLLPLVHLRVDINNLIYVLELPLKLLLSCLLDLCQSVVKVVLEFPDVFELTDVRLNLLFICALKLLLLPPYPLHQRLPLIAQLALNVLPDPLLLLLHPLLPLLELPDPRPHLLHLLQVPLVELLGDLLNPLLDEPLEVQLRLLPVRHLALQELPQRVQVRQS